jgi:hypothetical protein
LAEHTQDKLAVGFAAGKVAAAAQQHLLLHRLFEMPMRGLDIAILMPARGIGGLGLQAVMGQ